MRRTDMEDNTARAVISGLPENYAEWSWEEKQEWVGALLGTLSPSPEVRARSAEQLRTYEEN
jgi:hypothetical protein